jgi:hypothetical protein
MHQLLLGASIPFVLALLIYIIRRFRAPLWMLLATPPLMVAGAIWAVMPDIPRMLGMYGLYEKMQTPLSDIFFWHYTIDRMEATSLDPLLPLFNACFVLLPALLLLAAWRELRLRENTSPTHPAAPKNNTAEEN